VSYFTLRTIIVLMETMKDFYSSTTIPPSAAVATRRSDLRVNEYAALDQPFQHYQHCRQTKNCHCEKYFRVGRHVCQKLGHLLFSAGSRPVREEEHRNCEQVPKRPTRSGRFGL
jgi:hypothetical protein